MGDTAVKTYQNGTITITVLRSQCIGAATCVVYAPDTFDLDEEGIAIVKEGNWNELKKIISGAASCPVTAIEVYDNGKKVYPEEQK